MMSLSYPFSILVIAYILAISSLNRLADAEVAIDQSRQVTLFRRSTNDHKGIMHTHMSRKIFDRACAASKDTIEEIIACLTGNQHMLAIIKHEVATQCHKEAFGLEFDRKDVAKHKELICKNREKFEDMTACIYRDTVKQMDQGQIDKLTEAMVDVGLCVVNALDG